MGHSADDNEKQLAATQRLYDISQQIYWTEEWRSERASQTKAGMRSKLEERTSEKVAADISDKELQDRLAQTQGFADTASEIKAGVRAKLEERTSEKVAADISGKELRNRLAQTQGFDDTASEIKAGKLKATLKRFLAAGGSDDQFEHLKSLSPTVLWHQARLELASTIDATPPEALSALGLKRIINMRISLGLPGQIQYATKQKILDGLRLTAANIVSMA
eukprot:COSAG02_NODE_411_length_22864_cov_6.757523_16_plen_221_part_00